MDERIKRQPVTEYSNENCENISKQMEHNNIEYQPPDVSIKKEPEDVATERVLQPEVKVKTEPIECDEQISLHMETLVSMKQETEDLSGKNLCRIVAKRTSELNPTEVDVKTKPTMCPCEQISQDAENTIKQEPKDVSENDINDHSNISNGVLFDEELDENSAEERKYQCPACAKPFAKKGNMFRHMQLVHNTKQYNCQECTRVYVDKDKYDRHVLIKHTKKKHECRQCKKIFVTATSLKKHRLTHRARNFHCDECKKSLTTKYFFDNHKCLVKKPPKKPIISCDICNKVFKKEHLLDKHMAKHNRVSQYFCLGCKVYFKCGKSLKKHALICKGTDVKPLVPCDVCKKTFMETNDLKKHMTKHTDVKPYHCKICDVHFKYKSTFNKHIKRHGDVNNDVKEINMEEVVS